MFEYPKLLLSFFYYFISFSVYVWKRSFFIIKEYLSQLCGLWRSERINPPLEPVAWMYVKSLENKTFSFLACIFFSALIEMKLYNGCLLSKKASVSRHSVIQDHNVKIKNLSPIDWISIVYEGSLKCMSFEFPFSFNVSLKNIKIFTEFYVTPNGCKSTVDNIYIDDIKLKLWAFNGFLSNESSNLKISGILKIPSFFLLCLFEFIIMLCLKLKFSSTDFVYIHTRENSLRNSLINYMERTKNIAVGSSTSKGIVSVINDYLVEDDKKVLSRYFYRFLKRKNLIFEDALQMPAENAPKMWNGDDLWVCGEDVYLLQDDNVYFLQGEEAHLLEDENAHLLQGEDAHQLQGEDAHQLQGEDARQLQEEGGRQVQEEGGRQVQEEGGRQVQEEGGRQLQDEDAHQLQS